MIIPTIRQYLLKYPMFSGCSRVKIQIQRSRHIHTQFLKSHSPYRCGCSVLWLPITPIWLLQFLSEVWKPKSVLGKTQLHWLQCGAITSGSISDSTLHSVVTSFLVAESGEYFKSPLMAWQHEAHKLQAEIFWTLTGVLLLNNFDALENLLFLVAFCLTAGFSVPAEVLFQLLLSQC